MTPPVVSRGLLYICQSAKGANGEPTRLLCYDLRGTGSTRSLYNFDLSSYLAPMELAEHEIYDRIGEEGFARLVAGFYRRVPSDEILGPMYPAADLAGAELRLREFLIQRFGGPDRYSQQRGHPRLRMRHVRFHIDARARSRWIALMQQAQAEANLPDDAAHVLRNFFENTATFLINQG